MTININNSNLLKILYAPLLYTHRSYLSIPFLERKNVPDNLINYWIINYYRLDDVTEEFMLRNVSYVSKLLIDNWFVLPKVSFLIGCFLCRKLCYEDFSSKKTLLEFMSLPLSFQVQLNNMEHCNIIGAGSSFLYELGKGLPMALQQRLFLCFPKNISIPVINVPCSPHNINFLKVAISYANN
ncbi:hypothetical protein OQB17_004440 [Salmonella enterica]|nr:hypothetical protein [Salmonella enterica]